MHKSQPSHNGATNGQDQKCGSIGFWPQFSQSHACGP